MSSIPSVSYSLTETYLVDTILRWHAPDRTSPEEQTLLHRLSYLAKSEIGTRCIAIFISVFALVDTMLHLGTWGFKAVYYMRYDAPWNRAEISQHATQALRFSLLTVIGSLFFVCVPQACTSWRYMNNPPISDERIRLELDKPPTEGEPSSPSNFLPNSPAVPPLLKKLAQDESLFDTLKNEWNHGSLEFKRQFVQVFGRNDTPYSCKVRAALADHIYRPLVKATPVWTANDVRKESYFYSIESTESLSRCILDQRIDAIEESTFHGVFTTTEPVQGYGRYTLVFNSSIEFLSEVPHAFAASNRMQGIEQQAHFIGFSRSIPVTKTTLDHVMIDGDEEERAKLEAQLRAEPFDWIKSIKVIRLDDQDGFKQTKRLQHGVPASWPTDDPAKEQILSVLKVAETEQKKKEEIKPATTIKEKISALEEKLKETSELEVKEHG